MPKVLPPVRPNAGLESRYRAILVKMIRAMSADVTAQVKRAYKRNEPLATDELPAAALRKLMRKLSGEWQGKFAKMSVELGKYFAQAAEKRSTAQLRRILREGGFTVSFKMTRTMQDVMSATMGEQVGLIKSIPAKYFTEIEGAVMRSVSAGRDLAPLAKTLEDQYGVTRRRAAFIARDQMNKASATMSRVRMMESGISEAVWVHSGGGREPRPTHLAAGKRKQRFKIADGWFDPHEQRNILPGELPNCKCVARPVIEGIPT